MNSSSSMKTSQTLNWQVQFLFDRKHTPTHRHRHQSQKKVRTQNTTYPGKFDLELTFAFSPYLLLYGIGTSLCVESFRTALRVKTRQYFFQIPTLGTIGRQIQSQDSAMQLRWSPNAWLSLWVPPNILLLSSHTSTPMHTHTHTHAHKHTCANAQTRHHMQESIFSILSPTRIKITPLHCL